MERLLFDWSRAGARDAAAPGGAFFDETLRDGIQAPHVSIPALDEKLELIDHMVQCGIRYADAGFPGGGPAAAGDCLAIARHVATQDYPLALAYAGRTHPADVRAICDIAQRAGVPPQQYYDELTRTGTAGAIFGDVRRGKALALLMERVKITDTAGNPLDFDALRAPADEAGDGGHEHDH